MQIRYCKWRISIKSIVWYKFQTKINKCYQVSNKSKKNKKQIKVPIKFNYKKVKSKIIYKNKINNFKKIKINKSFKVSKFHSLNSKIIKILAKYNKIK